MPSQKRKAGAVEENGATSSKEVQKADIFDMDYIPLTTHPEQFGSQPVPMNTGAVYMPEWRRREWRGVRLTSSDIYMSGAGER